ncbi:hypothetical protein LPTSP2_37680 [Leptospira ellinghausenii]|uniref:Uncharacterized protein n=1 Tax=Leptospira ellinghausenii TaxID=1917822 RepID=A0A2P2DIM7_9LEPT|nr:hypothetical protein [Leptospira ellinghausenii]GBF44465.1 hypothetical protein LPTSP2_37680 [Leptospira ellinghausenii]
MENELKNKVTTKITDAIESRIKHPFIGTLIFSFLIKNFDILYKLLLSSSLGTQGIDSFLHIFFSDSSRMWHPILMACFVALFADSLLYNSRKIIETVFTNITNKITECINKLSFENRIRNLETTISSLSSENHKLREFIDQFIPALVEKLNTINPEYHLTYGETSLKKGDLVATDSKKGYVQFLNKGNLNNFCGVIHEKITHNLYILKNSFAEKDILDVGNGSKEFPYLAWDPVPAKLAFVSIMTNSSVQLGKLSEDGIKIEKYPKSLGIGYTRSFSESLLSDIVNNEYDNLNKLINAFALKKDIQENK